MKYFLVLGIEYKKYKNPATVTIYVGDKFVDTFQLDRDYSSVGEKILSQLETKWYEKFDRTDWISHPHWMKLWPNVPKFFKVYKLDESDLEGSLNIEVENANSDYTNGFFKNSSLLKFSVVALFKATLVSNRGEKMMKAFSQFGGRWLHAGQTKRRRHCWPNGEHFYVSRQKETFEQSGMRSYSWSIGGSFCAQWTIKTKHNTKFLTHPYGRLPQRYGCIKISMQNSLVLASYKPLLNIYDEDQ